MVDGIDGIDRLDLYLTQTHHSLPGIVTPDGRVRLLGCLSSGEYRGLFPRWPASNPVIPRSEWVAFDRTRPDIPILDQHQTGSCTGHGSVTALEYARAFAGMDYLALSACCIYGQVNGGRDAGANISDVMGVLLNTGTCLESQIPEGMIFSSRFPPGWQATAARFRAETSFSVESWDEVVSAAILGRPLSISVTAGNAWSNRPLDANGCPPVISGYGNHCVFMGSKLAKGVDGNWYLWGQNSWGTDWGLGGRFAISEAHLDHQHGFDAFAVSVPIFDPQGTTNPPEVA